MPVEKDKKREILKTAELSHLLGRSKADHAEAVRQCSPWVEDGHASRVDFSRKSDLWIACGAASTGEFASMVVILLRHAVQY
jgi:hypothetical protein